MNKFCGHKSVNWKPCPVRHGKGSRKFLDTQGVKSSEWGALATRRRAGPKGRSAALHVRRERGRGN